MRLEHSESLAYFLRLKPLLFWFLPEDCLTYLKNNPRPLLFLAMTLTFIRNQVNKLNSVFILSIFSVLLECVGMCVFSFLYLFCDHFLLAEATAFRVIPECSQYSQTLFREQTAFILPVQRGWLCCHVSVSQFLFQVQAVICSSTFQ